MSTYAVIIIPLVIGYLLDLVFGDPRKLPHPIVAFGNIIGWCERRFNKGEHKKRNGCLVAILLPLSTLVVGGGYRMGLLGTSSRCILHRCIHIRLLRFGKPQSYTRRR